MPRILIGTILILCVAACNAAAQLSPGDLSKVHETLEGLNNCSACHDNERNLASSLCMKCHVSIRNQRESKHGLHSMAEYQECQLCHVEHQGKDFKLITWKGGMTSFNHTVTGFLLDGKHAGIECKDCHAASKLTKRMPSDSTVNPATTFLGLDTACASCHFDEHRSQLGDKCASCHSTKGWKPAAGFDHASSAFKLAGKHAQVDCIKCHASVSIAAVAPGDDTSFQTFKPLQFDQCTDCHSDPHKGKLVADCSSCHSVTGWHNISTNKFDHGKTKYPLQGKHASVECSKCHTSKQERADLKFAHCTDCHTDFHAGAFASRPQSGACEECHTVKGFSPTSFTIAHHEKCDYPLRGAHLAIPCVSCHMGVDNTGKRMSRFVFKNTSCSACHRDPHNGEVKSLVEKGGCETCHAVDSWSRIAFDHGTTKFSLEGKHAMVQCVKCHVAKANSGKGLLLKMTGAKTLCAECHKDIHRGQFASNKKVTDCRSCHTPRDWHMATFDHDSASTFKLEGKHVGVACIACHAPIPSADGPWVRYKPLNTTCASCHGQNVKSERVVPW